jgi:DNA-binding NtrC family response regulator
MNNNNIPIVVVDDDQGILDAFDAMLGDDYRLIMVDNGNEAMALISEHAPRLLFLDIKMPKPSGMDVLKLVWERGMATKVVIVTALHQEHYEIQARKYGVYRYLRKPLDVDEVEAIATTVIH